MSNYTGGQKAFLWGTFIVLGLVGFLPASYGIYTVSERAGGLIPALLYSLTMFSVGSAYWLYGYVISKAKIDGSELKVLQLIGKLILLEIFRILSLIGIMWATIVLSYLWKLAGVAPFHG